MPSFSPSRPFNEKDLVTLVNGAPMFPPFPGLQNGQLIPGTQGQFFYAPYVAPATGILTSSGTAVNNVSNGGTSAAFATGTLNADGTRTTLGTLAGRTLAVKATAAGFFMPSDSPLVGSPTYWTVATDATIPPTAGTWPGIPIAAGEVKTLIMLPTTGWLQWISTTGTASLEVWEMF
jgi:hypothetical protein